MSKSITEKELAEKLREECDINRHNGWNHAARKIAEAMGVTLAPEKPEPGTWHITDGYMSPAPEVPAYVSEVGNLHLVHQDGRIEGFSEGSDTWPALTPAHVVPEAEWTELTAKAESQADAIKLLRQSRDNWAELAHKAEQETQKMAERVVPAEPKIYLTDDETSTLAKLDNARKAESVELGEEEVGALWDAIPGSRGRWREYTTPFQEHVTAVVNAAIAKHGHGRAEVSRADVEAALIAGLEKTMAILTPKTVKHATDAVMELLEASK